MAIGAGALAAVTAIAALASAGAQGYAAHSGAKQAERDRKYKQRQDLIGMQERGRDRATAEQVRQDAATQSYRHDLAQKPMNSLGLLSGLSNLQQGLGRSNSIDVLGYLAR